MHGNSWPTPRTQNHLRSKFGTQSKHRNRVIRIIPTSASLGPFHTSPVSQGDQSEAQMDAPVRIRVIHHSGINTPAMSPQRRFWVTYTDFYHRKCCLSSVVRKNE